MFTFAVDLQAATEFFRQYILPYAQTLIYALVPILTPYITNKVSSKFSDIKTMLTTNIDTISAKLSERINSVEKEIAQVKAIPEQVKAIVAPVFSKLDQIEDMMVALAANSRVPDEVKANIKAIRDNSMKAEDFAKATIDAKEQELIKVQAELNALKATLAVPTSEATPVAKDKKSKKSKNSKLW